MTDVDLEALSRHEFSRLVALIARRIGSERLDVAEDAVQDAFAAAVRHWGTSADPPANPQAWLYRAAWNRAVDRLRRNEPDRLDDLPNDPDAMAAPIEPGARDPELELILLCCHPSLSPESQVALTLKVAAGFSVAEIARLLGAETDAVDQRLVRAKRTIRQAPAPLEVSSADLGRRSAVARQSLYAIFGEGYASESADSGLRRELCFEALRLAETMLADPATAAPEGHALAALFAFHGSRLAERFDQGGSFQSLRTHDRTRWHRGLIARGLEHLRRSVGDRLSRFHLEAEIASCHAVATTFAATDWARIVELYTLLADLNPSPMVRLNRAIAVGERDGPAAGLVAVEALRARLKDNPYFHAALADLSHRVGDTEAARRGYQAALAAAWSPGTQRVIEDRLRTVDEPDVGFQGDPPSSH